MPVSLQQASAELQVHNLLDAGDADTLEAFADFAAGEIDDKHIAALLLAILHADNGRWAFMLSNLRSLQPSLADAIDKLENELDRQRAAFIEHEARELLAQADLHNEVAAEQARGQL